MMVMPQSFPKSRFIKEISAYMAALHYGPVPGPLKTCAALFYKKIDDLVLTVGLEFSTRYKERFTASFYLSKSFHWGYMLPGFPKRAFERFGKFLEAPERKHLLDPFFAQPGVVDAWWIGFTSGSVESFLEALRLTESRFVEQPGLSDEVRNCEELKKHLVMVGEVVSGRRALKGPPPNLVHQPSRYAPPIPREYYWAAELVLAKHEPGLASVSFTDLLAVDSWRIENLFPQLTMV